MTHRGGREASERSLGEKKRDRGRREAAGDGTTGCSMEVFQFGEIGSA